MNAWVLVRHGPPERAFALREIPDPVAGRGQVLIRSEGFGLNYADVMAAQGLYREAPPLPSVLGYEVVGRVEACGADVPEGLLGKRVVERRRLLEVTTSGRLMNVITLIYHATDANGLATEALESAPLPSVADHGELLELLQSALPASPRS